MIKEAMTDLEKAARMGLEFVEYHSKYWNGDGQHPQEIVTALREALAEHSMGCQCPACEKTLHASDCAVHNAPAYPVGECDCGAQPYPENFIDALKYDVARRDSEQQCRTDGRCQYAIDSGAEGMGHCPKGKCVMPAQQEPAAKKKHEPKIDLGKYAGTYGGYITPEPSEGYLEKAYRLANELRSHLSIAPAQRKPLTHEQRLEVLTRFKKYDTEWHGPAILIDLVEAAHGITGEKK